MPSRFDAPRKLIPSLLRPTTAPAALAQVNPVPAAGGDPNILELPAHTTGLGQGVATDGYGKPSKFEANVQRRQSPGLTQTQQSSVSFAPLQRSTNDSHACSCAPFTPGYFMRDPFSANLPGESIFGR